jgi:hypothetical protein
MVGAHADVGHSNALGQLCWVDPHHAQGPALGFRRGDLIRGCVWAESGEGGGCGDAEEEGEVGERFHVGVDQAMIFTTHAGILEGYLVSAKGKVAGTNPLGNEDINMLGSTRLDPGCY